LATGFGRGVCDEADGGGGSGPGAACAIKRSGAPTEIVASNPQLAAKMALLVFKFTSSPEFQGIHKFLITII
jgi:hypothetical protein